LLNRVEHTVASLSILLQVTLPRTILVSLCVAPRSWPSGRSATRPRAARAGGGAAACHSSSLPVHVLPPPGPGPPSPEGGPRPRPGATGSLSTPLRAVQGGCAVQLGHSALRLASPPFSPVRVLAANTRGRRPRPGESRMHTRQAAHLSAGSRCPEGN
jgi:hypothetical protein